MKVLSGKEVGQAQESELSTAAADLKGHGIQPSLAVILVGDNPESTTYVGRKLVAAEKLGIRSLDRHLPASIGQEALERTIAELNADESVHGVMCQLPLPPHLDPTRIPLLIDPLKDVDCFHPFNFGLLAQGTPRFLPCTPAGIMAMLAHYRIPVQGAHVVVLGRSNIVGRPMSLLLSQKGRDATVTVCHSRTRNLAEIARQADILVAAIGRPEWVGPEMVREGAVVIDVGINRVDAPDRPRGYRLCGDVAYEAVAPRTAAITPVPGGVGPLTVLMLMRNTLLAARLQAGLEMGEGIGLSLGVPLTGIGRRAKGGREA
jgi:methylenetetrahydrofolate dehydrogenase (NADP+)/methenyltetrahydrofolate cyclohydrolase